MAIITITNKRYTVEPIYQWNKNQKLKIYGLSLPSTPEIHFTNKAINGVITRQATMGTDGVITVDIPNYLLQYPHKITAYVCLYDGESFESRCELIIPITPRPKPVEYVVDEEEISENFFTS